MTMRGDLIDAVTGIDEQLPLPGHGATPERWGWLYTLARFRDVSLARLAEAHVDARAILAEAALELDPSLLFGVWASTAPMARPEWSSTTGEITGTMHFCSGLGLVDRALIAVTDEDGLERLVIADVSEDGESFDFDLSAWQTTAMERTQTGTAQFRSHPGELVDQNPGWYFARPGFWHGAAGPAACWAGAAAGLLDVAESFETEDTLRSAALGACRVEVFTMENALDCAGRKFDTTPGDAALARYVALATRATVEGAAARLLARFSSAFGPRPFVNNAALAARFADAHLYLRQCHGERDLATLGEADRRQVWAGDNG